MLLKGVLIETLICQKKKKAYAEDMDYLDPAPKVLDLFLEGKAQEDYD